MLEYEYQVGWSAEDQFFVGRVGEFPSLSWLDASAYGALSGIKALTQFVVQDILDEGLIPPKPGNHLQRVMEMESDTPGTT